MSIFIGEGEHIDAVIERDGVLASVTSGPSMRPLFKTGRDMVILKKADGILRKYDVALYKVKEKYILHRIIKVIPEKQVYIIRGDNTYKKETVPFNAVIAYLDSFNRKGKSRNIRDFSYRMYSVLWNFIYPIRYLFHLAITLLYKIYRKIRTGR